MNILRSYLGGKQAATDKRNAMALAAGGGKLGMAGDMGGGYGAAGDPSEIGMRLMADLARDFNLTPEQAAGFVGNLDHESGGFRSLQEIDPMIEGSRGGYGYAQWTGPRRRAFESWAAENGLDPASYEANYGFLRYELMNTPEGAVLGDLRGADDPSEAARIVSERFLRPGIPHMGSRISRAQSYFNNPMMTVAGG